MKMQRLLAFLGLALIILFCQEQIEAQELFWKEVNSRPLEGVSIRKMQVHPNGGVFAAAEASVVNFAYGGAPVRTGVLRSTDDGETWSTTSLSYKVFPLSSDTLHGIRSLAIDASGYMMAVNIFSQIFRSTDNGNSWEKLATSFQVEDIAFISTGNVVAVGKNGVYRSTNAGQTWVRMNNGLSNTTVHSVYVDSTRGIFVGTDAGVYRSTDRGASWLGGGNVVVYSIASNQTNGNLYAGTDHGLYLSVNTGQTWTNIGFANGYVLAVSVASNGYVFASSLGGGTFRSNDDGMNWNNTSGGTATCFALVKGNMIFGTDGQGVYRSLVLGNSWHRPYTSDAWVLTIATSPDGAVFAGTLGNYVFRTSDGGSSWNQLANGLTNSSEVALLFNPKGYLFVGTNGNGIFRSTDAGQNWVSSNNGIGSNKNVFAFAFDADKNIFAGCNPTTIVGGGVYASTDNGSQWTLLTSTTGDIYSLATGLGGRLFAGTSDGKVYSSADGGVTWRNTKLTSKRIRSIAPGSQGTIFAGADYPGGLYRSVDSGSTWTNIGFSQVSVTSILIRPEAMFVATYGQGVYRSTDRGQNWMPINDGLRDYKVHSMAFDASGFLFVGTETDGVFRSSQPLVTFAEEANGGHPVNFYLSQNFPNPFNPSTIIGYSIAKTSQVTLDILNILGQQIVTLVQEPKEAGYHQVQWHANVPSGIYFYRLQAGGFVETKKMILVR